MPGVKGNQINKALSAVFGAREKSLFLVWQIIVTILLAILFDTIDVLLEILFGAGLILDSIMGVIDFILFRLWLWFKGVNRTGVFTIVAMLEEIPALNAAPLTTLAIIITIIIHNKEVKKKDAKEGLERIEEAKKTESLLTTVSKMEKSLSDFSFNGLLSKISRRDDQ